MKYDPKRYDPDKARAVISELSKLCDPIALATYITDKAKWDKSMGKKHEGEAWMYTRLFFTDYGTPQRAEQVASLFEPVGVRDEQDAALWIAEHETLIP